jgi:hypothetical protein
MKLLASPTQPPADWDDSGADGLHEERKRHSENAKRRALAQTVLHEVLRRHSIPSDWIILHTLFVPNRTGGERLLLQLVVQKGDDQLVGHIQPLQEHFMRDLLRQDVRARDWIAALCWEFNGPRDPRWSRMPDPSFWTAPAAG